MSILSPAFFAFLTALLIVYYCSPKRYRWIALLLASLVFYCWGGRFKPLLYIGVTSFSTWLAALMMDRLNKWIKEYLRLNTQLEPKEKKAAKARCARNRKIIFLAVLILNLLILGVIKYTNFTLESLTGIWNALSGASAAPAKIDFLVPLGISYYTFQSIGYLIDIYQGKYDAESNYGKYALFVTYFPQIIQGPIGRYNHLGPQLTASNSFDPQNLKRGAILMLWGGMKKIVIANHLAPLVTEVCGNSANYDGSLILLATLSYCFQLYADFSGGIDMVRGASEMFGVKLAENFKRPYFAVSLGDFWRRWHISLGGWMRDYVFYPFAMSKRTMNLSKKIKVRNKYLAKAFPAIAGNVVVFLIVGLWHGAEWRFVLWGLYNGVLLGTTVLLEPLYDRFHSRFYGLKTSAIWHGFQIARTFLIVWIGNYFDCCQGIRDAFEMMRRSILDFHISALSIDTIQNLGVDHRGSLGLAIALPLLLIVSCAQERGVEVRKWLDQRYIAIRWILLYGLIFFTIAFAATGFDALEGFMYEIF